MWGAFRCQSKVRVEVVAFGQLSRLGEIQVPDGGSRQILDEGSPPTVRELRVIQCDFGIILCPSKASTGPR